MILRSYCVFAEYQEGRAGDGSERERGRERERERERHIKPDRHTTMYL